MKKSLIIILTLVMILSSLPVYGADTTVVKYKKVGDTIDLDALYGNGSVTWESNKFKAETKGVIHAKGIGNSGNVHLYIIVDDKVPTVTALEPEINYGKKVGKFSATLTGSESEYSAIHIFPKNARVSTIADAFDFGSPVYSGGAKNENGLVVFNADLSNFSNGDYTFFIVSATGEDNDDFTFLNTDAFVTAIKAIPATASDRGQQVIALCSDYAIAIKYDLMNVYSGLSETEKATVMAKIPERLVGYTGSDFNYILYLFNEEVALYKLKTAADVTTILEDAVNPYAATLGVDVSEDSFYKDIKDKTKFKGYFLSKDLSTKQNVQNAFYKGVALTLINEADNSNIKERLGNLDTINGVKALDIKAELDDLKELDNESNQDDNVYKKVVFNAPYTETTDLKTKLRGFITDETGIPDSGTGDSSDDEEGGSDGGLGGGAGGGGSLGGGPSGGGLGALGGNSAIADAKEEENKEETPSKVDAYSDIEDAEWARIYINKLSKLGVISGFEGKIRPNDPITKEEFAKLIVNAIGLTEKADNMKFSDVDLNEWYAEYISKLYKSGITTGVSATEFGTGTYISREDMAVLVHRAMNYINSIEDKAYEAENFADDSDISDYAKNAVYEIKALGIVNGVGENSFMPKGISSRAMAFKVISEAFYK